jgi:hypothetical protein
MMDFTHQVGPYELNWYKKFTEKNSIATAIVENRINPK